jgi:hypothetical protein
MFLSLHHMVKTARAHSRTCGWLGNQRLLQANAFPSMQAAGRRGWGRYSQSQLAGWGELRDKNRPML